MSTAPFLCHDDRPADERDELVARPPALIGTLISAGTNQTYARFERFWTSWATGTALQGLLVMGIAALLAPANEEASFAAWLFLRSGFPLAVLGSFGVFLLLSRRAEPATSTYIGELGFARVSGEPPVQKVEAVLYTDIVQVQGGVSAGSSGGVDYDWRFLDARGQVRLQVAGQEPSLLFRVNDEEVLEIVDAVPRTSQLLFAQRAEREWRERCRASLGSTPAKTKRKKKKR